MEKATSVINGITIFEIPSSKIPSEGAKECNVGEIKALLSLNFRIAVYLREIGTAGKESLGELIEYHFVRNKQYDGISNIDLEMQVNCVLCKSKIGDSLKLCGITKSFTDFKPVFEIPRLTGNYVLYFERYRIAVFPFNWYPCFEKDDSSDPRWKEIEATLPMIPSLSLNLVNMEELQKKNKREKEESQKREKEEQEKKRRDEENRKREESRRKMEELARSLEIAARADDNPEEFAKFMMNAMKKK